MRSTYGFVAAAVFALAVGVPCVAAAGDDAPAAGHVGVVFEPGAPAFADVLAKAKAEQKVVFLDFATDWCGWCKKLDKDTFSQASVAAAMKGFVAVHVDAEKGEGVGLAKRYGARGFPTLVVVDAAGEEIDRIVGYLAPEPFVKEIGRIARGEGTLPALKKQVADRPDDLGLALDLADKLADSDGVAALALAEAVEGKASAQPVLAARALATQLRVHRGADRADRAEAVATTIVDKYPDQPAAQDAFQLLVFSKIKPVARGQQPDVEPALAAIAGLRGKTKDGALPAAVERMAAQFHRMAAEAAIGRAAVAAGDDAQALNEAAWSLFLMKGDLRPALAWATKAAELSQRDPAILDTLANITAEMGRLDEAIALEEEAARKVDDARMRTEFDETLAKWKAVRDLRKAGGRTVIPALPMVAPTGAPTGAPTPKVPEAPKAPDAPSAPDAPKAPAPGGGACGGGK